MNETDQKAVGELKVRVGELASHFTDFDFLRYLQGYDYKIDDLVPFIQKNCEILRAIDAENYQIPLR
uniref:Uncharacterized protein n=1 Tax=Romanomermis culicivorax TaxID=13658 RepID=A0A915KHQ8_ROMCU